MAGDDVYLATNWDTDVVLSRSPASIQVGWSHDEGMLFSDWVRLRSRFHSMVTSRLDKASKEPHQPVYKINKHLHPHCCSLTVQDAFSTFLLSTNHRTQVRGCDAVQQQCRGLKLSLSFEGKKSFSAESLPSRCVCSLRRPETLPLHHKPCT